jgi:hypothetical protein
MTRLDNALENIITAVVVVFNIIPFLLIYVILVPVFIENKLTGTKVKVMTFKDYMRAIGSIF